MQRKATAAERRKMSQFVEWIEHEGLEDAFYLSWLESRKVKGLEFSELSRATPDSPPNFGTPVMVSEIDQFLKAHHHIRWQRNPIYIEFDMTKLIGFAGGMAEKISLAEEVPGDYKCRVYFISESKNDCIRTGLVLVIAKKTVDITTGDTFFVDQTDVVYDVGAACPPACKSGSLMSNGSLAAKLAEKLTQEEQECLRNLANCGCKPA